MSSADYGAMIVSQRPTLYWPLDEKGGNTAFDSSGNHFDGTFQGGRDISSVGIPLPDGSGTLTLNGSSQYVVANANPAALQSSQFTLAAWIKPASLPGSAFIMGRARNFTFLSQADGTIQVIFPFLSNPAASTLTCPAGVWSHAATTCDGTTVSYFVNGRAAGTGAVGGAIDTNLSQNFAVGRDNVSQAGYFPGSISQALYANRVMAQGDLLAQVKASTVLGTPMRVGSQ